MKLVKHSVVAALLAAAVGMSAAAAHADVRHEGSWEDDDDETVTLDLVQVPRGEPVKRLAAEAGWSVVFEGAPTDPVDVHVKDQPAARVLDILLGGGDYVARRDEELVAIRRADPHAVPAPAGQSRRRAARGGDRMVTGSSLTVERGDTMHDVAVMGGSAEVYGTVTGDLLVTGGSATIHRGAHVVGDVHTMGGSIDVEDGAVVDGDLLSFGGSVHRAEGATVRGDTRGHGRHEHDHDHHASRERSSRESTSRESRFAREVREAGSAVTRMSLLFVFGCVLLALATPRMETLRVQIAAHPMRTLAKGVVGLLGAALGLVLLCVTVVGIPFAILGVLVGCVLAAAGMVSALETLGCALLNHRTKNPYVHLAAGCLLLLVLGVIPFVGGVVHALVLLAGVGAIVSTRAGGLLRRRGAPALDVA